MQRERETKFSMTNTSRAEILENLVLRSGSTASHSCIRNSFACGICLKIHMPTQRDHQASVQYMSITIACTLTSLLLPFIRSLYLRIIVVYYFSVTEIENNGI